MDFLFFDAHRAIYRFAVHFNYSLEAFIHLVDQRMQASRQTVQRPSALFSQFHIANLKSHVFTDFFADNSPRSCTSMRGVLAAMFLARYTNCVQINLFQKMKNSLSCENLWMISPSMKES